LVNCGVKATTTNQYFRTPQGHYGRAVYVISRRAWRIFYLYPDGSELGGRLWPEADPSLALLRAIKRRPSKAALRKAGW
jgi:hypothetical protein